MKPNTRSAPPRAMSMLESLRGLGYSTGAALADIIDNSVSAGATEVRLDFAWDNKKSRPEAEIGLIGELTLLQSIIEAGVAPATAIESWVGPLDGIQDFEIGAGALEVKATLSAAGFPARIGSLEQLDDSTRQPLFVAGARLRQTDSGQNLPGFVEAMRQAVKGDAEAAGSRSWRARQSLAASQPGLCRSSAKRRSRAGSLTRASGASWKSSEMATSSKSA